MSFPLWKSALQGRISRMKWRSALEEPRKSNEIDMGFSPGGLCSDQQILAQSPVEDHSALSGFPARGRRGRYVLYRTSQRSQRHPAVLPIIDQRILRGAIIT